MSSLRTIYRCPYCPRDGTGEVAIDPASAARIARKESGVIEADVAGVDPEAVFVFAPDRSGLGPCPHVISLLIDVELGLVRRAGRDVVLTYVVRKFDHPSFATDPLREPLEEYLWTEVKGGTDRAFHPTSPFVIDFPSLKIQLDRGSKTRSRVGGTMIVALEPRAFIELLRTGYLARQAYYAANRSAGEGRA